MTPDDINQITGDDVMYWLGNKFMSPELLAEKVCYWADAIVAARLAPVEAERDQHSPGETCAEADERFAETWARAEAAGAEVARLRALVERHGPCAGCSYDDGPDEFCPQHGRPYNDALDYVDRIVTTERAEVARLTAVVEAVEALADWCEDKGDAVRSVGVMIRRRLASASSEDGAEPWVCAGCGSTAEPHAEGWAYTDAAWCADCGWLR